MTAPVPVASDRSGTVPETVYINGVTYHVIDERDGQIQVRRPNGVKLYRAIRLPDSPLYGESRARLVPTRIGDRVRESGGLT